MRKRRQWFTFFKDLLFTTFIENVSVSFGLAKLLFQNMFSFLR